jgi:hypothetical protein
MCLLQFQEDIEELMDEEMWELALRFIDAAEEERGGYWQNCKSKILEYVSYVDICCITICTHMHL